MANHLLPCKSIPNTNNKEKGTIPFPPSESGRATDTTTGFLWIAQSATSTNVLRPSVQNKPVVANNESPGETTEDGDRLQSVPDVPETAHVETIQLTRYIDQVPQQVSLYQSMKAGLRVLFGRESIQQSIEGILGRPRQLAPIMWTQDQALGEEILTLKMPQRLWDDSTTVRDKLNNFTFLKATVNLRLALNAMQFHQGRLLLSFDPLRSWRGARSRNSLWYQTGLRHVQIDPNKHQEGVLSVDFSAPITHWDLQTGHYDFGDLFVSVLSPLRSAVSSQSVSITPTLYMTNIELQMPTTNEIWRAQSLMHDVAGALQSGASLVQRPFQKSDDESGLRPISGAFSDAAYLVGHTGNAVGRFIPPVKAITSSASWILSFASKAARWLGFNKPTSYQGATPIFNVAGWPNHLMDGGSQAIKLSGAQDQSFPVLPDVFGTDIDECDISYVVSKLNYVTSFDYTENNSGQSILFAMPIHPGLCRVRNSNGEFYYDTTQLAYVSSLFRRWTGGIKIRLSCVSTTFHAGRLLVAYIPSTLAETGATPNLSNAWSIVWDISESNELEFEIPWLSNVPAKQVFLDSPNGTVLQTPQTDDVGILNDDEFALVRNLYSNGTLIVSNEGPLIRAENASDVVSIQVFVAGGKDFELFQPENGSYEPIYSTAQPYRPMNFSILKPIASPSLEFEAQSLRSMNPFYKGSSATPASMLDQHMRDQAEPFFDVPERPHLLAAGLVAGEKWKNLRQLTRRLHLYTQANTGGGNFFVVDPSLFQSTSAASTTRASTSYLDLVSALYAGYRGCVRYHVRDIVGNAELISALRLPLTVIGRSPMSDTVVSLPNALRAACPPRFDSATQFEVDVPLTSMYPWHVIRCHPSGENATDTNTPYSSQDLVAFGSDDNTTLVISRGAGDDGDFGILVGAPRVVKQNMTLSWTNPRGDKTIHR